MKFDLTEVKSMIDNFVDAPTGDPYIDNRYQEQVGIIGHVNAYYRLFWQIARRFKPGLCVELGSWRADAACHLAAGNPAGRVITIDIHKDDPAAKIKSQEADAHYPNLTYINGWTWDVVGQVPAGIDLLYVDSWHDYQYAIRDWNDYSKLLSGEALVICDDILPDDPSIGNGMFTFWAEVIESREAFLDMRPHVPVPMGFVKWTV